MSSSPQSRLVNELYLAASMLDGDEREQYLNDYCPDPAIRQLVESMLTADLPAPLEPGSYLGHYRILAKLGTGGMGSVYEALDSKLNRTVAIKVLRGKQPGAPAALAREAQAASALNHPNIVTVYEIGHEGATEFIAMERIAGRTLGSLIGRHGIELREGLRLAAQIADALAVAHEAGIVHRDLKPGNVMVTERGLVKVLDFGLAKRIAPDQSGKAGDHPTATLTRPGRVFGTIAYMSPEQAQGLNVDNGTDIFSFGCLLYEMMTGHRAFHEEGDLLTLAAVVGKDPRPAREFKPGLPNGLQRIIETCLRKRRVDRWHSMADIKLLIEQALEDLQNHPAATERTRPPRRRLEIALAALAGVGVAAGAFWAIARQSAEIASVPVLRRVTMDPGLSAFPSLSRAGNLLAFASDRGNASNLDIWVQQVGGREPLQLTHDAADDSDPDISPEGTRIAFRSERTPAGVYVVPALGGEEVLLAPGGRNPRFSPDGKWIAYWEGRELGGYLPGSARVFVVEAGGGQPRQIGQDMAAALYPVWSPKADGVLVLGRRDREGPLEASLDWWFLPLGSGPLEKGSAKRTGALAQLQKQGLMKPAWEVNLTPLSWRGDVRSRVLFAAGPADSAGAGDVGNLWEIEIAPGGLARGAATPLTSGPGYHLQASVSPGAGRDRMAFANLEWKVGVWETALDADRGLLRGGEFKMVTGSELYAAAPSLSRDGTILAFGSRRLGRWGLHTRDMSTGKEITLVSSGPMKGPVSGDGSTIVYGDFQGNIFTMPRSGGKVERLCDQCGDPMGVSYDGKKFSYEPLVSENLTLYDAAQRKSVILAPRPADTVLSGGRFSPDEKWIAFHAVQTRLGTTQVWLARIDGGLPVPQTSWIPVTDGQFEERDPVWSPSGDLLYFLSDRDGFRCVWARKLDPTTRRPIGEAFGVAHFHSARRSLKRTPGPAGMIGLSIAPGRMMLAFGELTGNIWLEEMPR